MSSKEIEEVELVFGYIPKLTNWTKKKNFLYFLFYFFILLFSLTLCIGSPKFSTTETVTKTFNHESPENEFILQGVQRKNQYLEGGIQYHNKADFGIIANVELHFTIYGSNQEENNKIKWDEIKTYSLQKTIVSSKLEVSETIASLSLPFIHYKNYKVHLVSNFTSGSQFFDFINFKKNMEKEVKIFSHLEFKYRYNLTGRNSLQNAIDPYC
ncbi:hypothetical protein M0812_25857 [Anaeramoeba flamelloides]|uniref:Uncharacterized protein n=1 Tax=Anaeramoeba flamelloides TaxID=1746091 RepID=A0AAV7YH12_9EUKA|nr:hypothetical protein M0812_25857 [Anaeramoeba flamelloides]